MEAIVGPILSALVAAAPGLLALITGKQSDEEAKAHALASLASLRLIDVDGIIGAHRKAPPPVVHAADLATLRPLAAGAVLSHEERAALSRLLASTKVAP